MDRLYREIRLGIVTPEMGRVLFDILTRLQDSNLVASGPRPERTKAARMRPKLTELLTRQERAAWKRAVDHATALGVEPGSEGKRRPRSGPAIAKPAQQPPGDTAVKLKLQAAS
jgi:hypothetical protein